MQTHVQTPAQHANEQSQLRIAQLSVKPLAAFNDCRTQTSQLKSLQAMMDTSPQQQNYQTLQARIAKGTPVQMAEKEKPNNTGLPNQLKAGIESLSGISMESVKVHYNSDKPAQLNAHAYAQGNDIHVAPGKEQHLPHEAWHLVQQAQGRVKPTTQLKAGVPVNDDVALEHEADVMGAKALTDVVQAKTAIRPNGIAQNTGGNGNAVQLYSYAAGSTKTITLKNAASTEQTNIDVCTQNSVTYSAGDAKQTGSISQTVLQ